MTLRRIVKIDPQTWPMLSQLLDEWLELYPEARSSWLENLGPEYADVLPALRELLATQTMGGADTFLNALPALSGAGESAAAGFAVGMQIGPYRLARELGHGGMGVVWLAERADGALKRPVALKLPAISLHQGGPSERFARERDILAHLAHPNIARLYDAGMADGGQPYLALEYVNGEAITAYCDRQVLSVKARLKLFLDVLGAVQYAHTNLVVHRDLKPSNIMVTGEGEVRLLDFGIAKLLTAGEARETELTRLEGRALTPDYASPEQITGDAVTTASDVYSLGVVLYELLTGERPYRLKRDTRGSLEEAILSADVARPGQVCRDEDKASVRGLTPKRLARTLQGDVDTIVLKALQKQPSQRYSTADAFAQDVQRYLRGEAVLAQPESVWYRGRKFVLRNKLAVASAAGIVMALAVGLSVALWEIRAARLEQKRADAQAATAKAVTDFLQNDLLAQASANSQAGSRTKPDPDLKVRTALDRAAAQISGKFSQQPLLEASIRQTLGITYRELGLFPEAEGQLQKVFDLRRRVLGERHANTLDAMSLLALLYHYEGKYAQSEPLTIRALELQRKLLGEQSKGTLKTMNDLAVLYHHEGKYAKAEPLLIRAIELQTRLLGENDPDTLNSVNNLATLYEYEGKYVQAEPLFNKVLQVRRLVLGEEHPNTLISTTNLAELYQNQGKYAEAEPLCARVLEVQTRILGPEHPDTLKTTNDLAMLYWREGKYAQAEPLSAKFLEASRRTLGRDHPLAQSGMNNLSKVYSDEGKYSEAERLLTELLEIVRRVAGTDHPNTLITMANLADEYRIQGKYRQAERLFNEALQSQTRVVGQEHPATVSTMNKLGLVYLAEGKYAQAEPLFKKTMELQQRALGAERWQTSAGARNLAHVYLLERHYAESEELLRQVLNGFERNNSDEWRRYDCQSMLGWSLAGQKRYAEAEPLLIAGYRGMVKQQDTIEAENRVRLQQSATRVVELYENWGKPNRAAEWRRKVKQTKLAFR